MGDLRSFTPRILVSEPASPMLDAESCPEFAEFLLQAVEQTEAADAWLWGEVEERAARGDVEGVLEVAQLRRKNAPLDAAEALNWRGRSDNGEAA